MIVWGSPRDGGSIAHAATTCIRWLTTTSRKRADRVVEVAAVGDVEVLGHRDLHRGQVVPAPERLEHGVREPEVEDLLEPHLSEVVVDPVQLRLVDVLVQLVRERLADCRGRARRASRRRPARLRQPGVGQALHDPSEEERGDLEVEDGVRLAADRGRRRARRSRRHRNHRTRTRSARKAAEHILVERLAGADDGLARPLDQLLDRPVVDRDADDRAVQQPASLEPVQRPERHHLREIAGDSEDDEHVCGLLAHSRSPLLLVDICPHCDPARPLVGEPGPGPVDHGLRPILTGRRAARDNGSPGERRGLALHRSPAPKLHDCGTPAECWTRITSAPASATFRRPRFRRSLLRARRPWAAARALLCTDPTSRNDISPSVFRGHHPKWMASRFPGTQR